MALSLPLLVFILLPVGSTIAQSSGAAQPSGSDPTNIFDYPFCSQLCSNETETQSYCGPADLNCQCAPIFRSEAAACEAVTCSQEDFDTTFNLAQELCANVYAASPAVSTSVSSAIAAATSAAKADVAGKDVTDQSVYPQCIQACQKQNGVNEICGSFANRTCVCQNYDLVRALGFCEATNCSVADNNIVKALTQKLCNPVGGIGGELNGTFIAPAFVGANMTTTANVTNSTNVTTGSGGVTHPLPSPSPFLGGAAPAAMGNVGGMVGVVVVVVGVVGGMFVSI
ncbi:MAG: hypothetical protein OHK93_002064 [Ramalina farinacea]|uniref:CFEM domain-containing protein n=1 Tax=Ramalina farinacea TaxID=258253 RepID=A0AA43TWV1_9LECA|nr:hypothetical protein [Ramalina farinacea]